MKTTKSSRRKTWSVIGSIALLVMIILVQGSWKVRLILALPVLWLLYYEGRNKPTETVSKVDSCTSKRQMIIDTFIAQDMLFRFVIVVGGVVLLRSGMQMRVALSLLCLTCFILAMSVIVSSRLGAAIRKIRNKRKDWPLIFSLFVSIILGCLLIHKFLLSALPHSVMYKYLSTSSENSNQPSPCSKGYASGCP